MPSASAHEGRDRPEQLGSSAIWSRVAGPAVVLLLPLLVIGGSMTILVQAKMLDPYVYTAYIHDYRQTYLRFGATYYSTRIAAIDLSRLVRWLVHSQASYYIVRYILLAGAASSIYSIARRYYSVPVAVVAAVWLCFSPWYVRAISWDYVDGFAITYLLIALAFLIAPRRHVALGHFMAGVFVAFAINSNLFTLAIAGSFAPSWYVLRSRDGLRRSWPLVLSTACGFLVAYAALGISLHLEFPQSPLFFEQPMIRTAGELMRGGSAQYFHPLSTFLFEERHNYILVPLALCLAMAILLARIARGWSPASKDFVRASGIYMLLITGIYLVNHFGLHHGRITLFYYFSYSVVASCLATTALIGESVAAVKDVKAAGTVLGVGVAAYLFEYMVYSTFDSRNTVWPVWAWACTAVVLPLCFVIIRQPLVRLSTLLVCLVAVPIPFYHSAEDYGSLHQPSERFDQWDVYNAAIYFQTSIGRAIPDQRQPVKFWYAVDDLDHRKLNSVQSMYLWGYSRIVGMPKIDEKFKPALEHAPYLVILGLSDEENQRALTALSDAHIDFREVTRDRFEGVGWGIQFVVLRLLDA